MINAINNNPSLAPLYPGDPRGAADNPLNYPVGTVTIFNGLGNFSENSAFNRSGGGHFDTRIEGYVGDTFNLFPNLNISFGVNYVRDTGRTNSDLAAVPCSAINRSIVPQTVPCPSGFILDQFGLIPNAIPPGPNHQSLGQIVSQPDWNFAPQFGVAWDPGHNGRMVVRASAGLFYDNFLLQNAYQDRINRLSNGQYNRSLTLCPAGAALFPNGSVVNSVDGVDIATGICGTTIGAASTAIQDLQSQFMLAQSAVTGGQNVYSLANSVANFGGLLAPGFKTPRVVHMDFGIQKQIGESGVFSVDYVRELGTQFPLGIDTNHVGGSNYLTDGDNLNPLLNTYQAELDAITATVASAGCGPATFDGRQFADCRELLSSRRAGSDHHRFRAPWAGFVERVLRTVSVFGARKAAGSVRRDQSGGGLEHHVLSERAVAVPRSASGVQDERGESDEACAAAGHCDGLRVVALSQQPGGAERQRRRLFADERGGRFQPAAPGTFRVFGAGPDAPVHVHSDGGVAARTAAFDDRASGVAASAEPVSSAAGRRRSGGGNLPQRYFRRRHRGRSSGVHRKHGKILDQPVDPVAHLLQLKLCREVDAGGSGADECPVVHRVATGGAGRLFAGDSRSAGAFCRSDLAEDDRLALELAVARLGSE